MITWKLLAVVFGSATVALAMLVVWQLVERAQVRRRYAPIRDLERELAKKRHSFTIEMSTREHVQETELSSRRRAFELLEAGQRAELDVARRELADARLEAKVLRDEHTAAQDRFHHLRGELAKLELVTAELELGFADRPLPAAASVETAQRLGELREEQKAMVHGERALTCWTPWAPGVRRDGEQIQRQVAKLLVRAFNAECDAAIARLAWNNLTQMVVRITHAFTQLNKLGAALELELAPTYRALKLEELRLEHACLQGRPTLDDLHERTPIEIPREDMSVFRA